ncbi:helix-turn-helix domain-containing protein [Clostridium perfringens]|uniref:helix-turn-helix domain-containing protein n=1 Tax=Clostridium perfringens TaxID=1502 RepID=UPI003992E601|nr:helix-turn-helix transcriptional regulator [Clostridium perfringens]
MIKIKLSELLGMHKMTRKKLAELVGVRPNMIGDMYNGKIKKIDIEVLNKICIIFDCKIEDILIYIPEDSDNN